MDEQRAHVWLLATRRTTAIGIALIGVASLIVATAPAILLGVALLAAAVPVWRVRRAADVVAPGEDGKRDLAAARAIVERFGEDSISPFILRPDKAFVFAAGGVLAYRVFGATAVVSGDPVGPPGSARAVLAHFLDTARRRGWNVVMYGASGHHLADYRTLGLRVLCVGEEAVADPSRFTLDGRPVRKLRQSVNRIERRGWAVTAIDGRDIDAGTEAEIEALESRWRDGRDRLLGFTMGLGVHEDGVSARDLYLLARSPEGDLAATMRFISHRGKLSLDTMRRVGETPNGLNEALVCRALELARDRGVAEVSLNYAGLAHLIRHEPQGGWLTRRATRWTTAALGRRFQMERLVRFNEKFTPDWRPRYLVYTRRRSLAASVLRILQAEGYVRLPERTRRAGEPRRWPALPSIESSEAGLPGVRR